MANRKKKPSLDLALFKIESISQKRVNAGVF